MSSTFEMLGMIGIGISIVAYIPQVSHLAKERCSSGISIRTWEMWLASSLLIGALAIYRKDYVFVTLTATNLLSALISLYMARRYKGMAATHTVTSHL